MGRLPPLLLGLGGCFAPAPAPGAPCGDGDLCPAGQRCVAMVCRAAGDLPDDAPVSDATLLDGGNDAPVDGPPSLGVWGTPTKIPGVNSSSPEGDPSLTPDRLTICFSSSRNAGQGEDLFLGTRATIGSAFTVAPITIANSVSNERSCEISADGNTIYFTSDRNGNMVDDIFVSTKVGGAFTAPTLVTELSTTLGDESDVTISPDGLTAMIARGNDIFLTGRASPTAAFTAPVLVANLGIMGTADAPSITNGATAVYLHGNATRDLFVAHRQGNGFTTPVPITELNTAGRDAAPFVSNEERYLAFERSGELFETTR